MHYQIPYTNTLSWTVTTFSKCFLFCLTDVACLHDRAIGLLFREKHLSWNLIKILVEHLFHLLSNSCTQTRLSYDSPPYWIVAIVPLLITRRDNKEISTTYYLLHGSHQFWTFSVADLRGARRPPMGVQILSISCSFWEILAKSYVGAPTGELAPLPRGNPGSATAFGNKMQWYGQLHWRGKS